MGMSSLPSAFSRKKIARKGAPAGETSGSSSPYSAWGTLLPSFWLPTLYGDHDGTVVGAMTAGQDAIGYNSYYLEGGYGVGSGEGYGHLFYRNDYYYPTVSLEAYRRPLAYALYRPADDDYEYFYEEEKSLSLSVSLPVNRLESRTELEAGFEWQERAPFSDLTGGQFYGVDIFEGRSHNAFVGLSHGSSLKYPYSISREEGWDGSLYYHRYAPGLGSDFELERWLYTLSLYGRLPFTPARHDLLSLSIRGGASNGDDIWQMRYHLGGIPNFTEFPLRGYPDRFLSGKNIVTTTLEYRLPLWYILRGWNTKPFFFDRLHTAAFLDGGVVWDDADSYDRDEIRCGAGVEVRFDMVLGYLLEITPAIGIAQGLGHGGEAQAYFTIYVDL